MSTEPAWIETALAYLSIVIAGLTGLASFLDWAVPRLAHLAMRRGAPDDPLPGFVEGIAGKLGAALAILKRYIPRLAMEPVTPVSAAGGARVETTSSEDDDDSDDEDDDPSGSAGAPAPAATGLPTILPPPPA